MQGADGIAWLAFDKAGTATNTLSTSTLAELNEVLDRLDREPPTGLVIRSAKRSGFIAGADVDGFGDIGDAQAARALVERGWNAFERLARAPYPTLALIRGFCLGGGLELALACRYRVVVDEPSTRLGLPEVMLGIVPGWGGIRRLPRLVGGPAALDLLLTGKTVDARKARRLGLADECVPPRIMDNTARCVLLAQPAARSLPFPLSLTLTAPARRFIGNQARQQVARRARREHYPAPYAIIDLWQRYDGNALAAPPGDPAAIDTLLATSTAANLIRVFHLQERLKALGKASGFPAARVHVVGAGTMGGDIAAWCALRGMTVTLQDQDAQRLSPAIKRAAKLYSDRLKDPRLARDALDRLIPDVGGHGVAHADVVIEAIFENVDAKRALFAELEARARPDAILATNTSSIPLEDIAVALRHPSRLIGLHFFNPVARMMLVEIVAGRDSDPALAARGAAFARAIDKLPLPVKSAPGFLVNRVLAPYLMSAMRCVDEGIASESVDAAAVEFGMPMGPIELADTVGLDICVAVGRILGSDAEVPRRLAEHVAAGHLGKKTGQGFYSWSEGKPRKRAAGAVPAGLAQRLVDPLVAEAQATLALGIVADADLVDAGAIFGAGFAPFRGGPLHYAGSAGAG
ncbi:MAG TPA: 3-hydroxyacyl-CoA dehydrogenase NAD-binding domain-containing protein, partial [Casimicrobiaceae bacterium]|nr:3-hydroxyacyl-CoA dehydrogenase NAD-binding domain-containing protein [Casimicrobiaceae bacterium]